MAAILEPDIIVTSYDLSAYVADLEGNMFGRLICPPSFVVIALIFLELRGGGRISPHPRAPVPEDQKKPGLNRVYPR